MNPWSNQEILQELLKSINEDGLSLSKGYVDKIKRYINGCTPLKGKGWIKINNCSNELIIFFEKLKKGDFVKNYLIRKFESKEMHLIATSKMIHPNSLENNYKEIKISIEENWFKKDITFVIQHKNKENKLITIFIDNLLYKTSRDSYSSK